MAVKVGDKKTFSSAKLLKQAAGKAVNEAGEFECGIRHSERQWTKTGMLSRPVPVGEQRAFFWPRGSIRIPRTQPAAATYGERDGTAIMRGKLELSDRMWS